MIIAIIIITRPVAIGVDPMDSSRVDVPTRLLVSSMLRSDGSIEVGAPWDGVWRLAAFAVPEPARRARDSLREAILFLGGAPVQSGLYVSANSWDEILVTEATRLGVREALTHALTTDLRVGQETDPDALAARL